MAMSSARASPRQSPKIGASSGAPLGSGAFELHGLGELPPIVAKEICTFVALLRRRQDLPSIEAARRTLKIMREVVTHTAARDVSWLIESIKRAGGMLVAAKPHELAIGNMVRRVLHVVREELHDAPAARTGGAGAGLAAGGGAGSGSDGPSLMRMLDAVETPDYLRLSAKDLKKPIHAAITELDDEIATAHENIADQAIEHIHANEVILTHGRDATVEIFLRAAAKKRQFEVIVAETSPSHDGHATAAALAAAGIATTLIADCAVFAMMARVNKVIVGAHAVMANGGIYATASCHLLALAAHHHSVPLVVCAGLYRLAPLFPSGPEQFNSLLSPHPLLPFHQVDEGVLVANPAFDYVPPDLVSLLITNIGGNHPSYVYRLLQEYYHPDDHQL